MGKTAITRNVKPYSSLLSQNPDIFKTIFNLFSIFSFFIF